jgi:hypothetical protein
VVEHDAAGRPGGSRGEDQARRIQIDARERLRLGGRVRQHLIEPRMCTRMLGRPDEEDARAADALGELDRGLVERHQLRLGLLQDLLEPMRPDLIVDHHENRAQPGDGKDEEGRLRTVLCDHHHAVATADFLLLHPPADRPHAQRGVAIGERRGADDERPVAVQARGLVQ